MSEAPAFERLLRRERAISLAGLAILCALAWLYMVMGAGLGMSAWEMTALTLFPHQQGLPAPSSGWAASTWLLIIAMWWIMMIAMMTPSAAPAILLYARVHHHALARDRIEDGYAPIAEFVAGYLSVWFVFSAVAAAMQWLAERTGLVSVMMMGSRSRWLSAGVLIAAGIYQLSSLKGACLAHCRSPVSFLSRHWRPRAAGAFRLGIMHGAYCVGCCWLLMALLFVGGVMNIVWIAALTLLVMMEKMLVAGPWIGRGSGVVLLGWGIATLIV